jgi:chromosome segregation ATPase
MFIHLSLSIPMSQSPDSELSELIHQLSLARDLERDTLSSITACEISQQSFLSLRRRFLAGVANDPTQSSLLQELDELKNSFVQAASQYCDSLRRFTETEESLRTKLSAAERSVLIASRRLEQERSQQQRRVSELADFKKEVERLTEDVCEIGKQKEADEAAQKAALVELEEVRALVREDAKALREVRVRVEEARAVIEERRARRSSRTSKEMALLPDDKVALEEHRAALRKKVAGLESQKAATEAAIARATIELNRLLDGVHSDRWTSRNGVLNH